MSGVFFCPFGWAFLGIDLGMDRITMRFAATVLKDEWAEFEDVQDRSIQMYTRRVSGTLRNEHGNRKYSVNESGMTVTGVLVHPDYERFLDMKKDRIVHRKVSVFHDRDRIVRRKGRNIHNKVIFGRLNPITFRLMHELRADVVSMIKNTGIGK